VSIIDAGKIEAYKTWRVNTHKVRDITIRHDLHALSKFFGFAIRQHWAYRNPIREVEIPSDANAVRMHILTPEEESEYFKRATKFPNLHDVGRLMINQGIRPAEATVLAKADIDFDRGEIHIQKSKSTASTRILNMTAESRSILRRRMEGDSPWIFPSRRKHGCHIGRINNAHDSVVKHAAQDGVTIEFVPYDFRHTFATHIAQDGVDLVTLSALLGHESLRVLKKYVHPSAEHKKAAMEKYDRLLKEDEQTSRFKSKGLDN
jgi:integrase